MGNLTAALAHCGRGDEAILGHLSHTYINEQGGLAAVGSIHPRPCAEPQRRHAGLEDVEAAIRTDNLHYPRTRLIMVENTHNLCNGVPLSPEYMGELGTLARRHGLKVHVDGAADLQCCDCPGCGCAGTDCRRRFRDLLPQQGVGRASGFHAVR